MAWWLLNGALESMPMLEWCGRSEISALLYLLSLMAIRTALVDFLYLWAIAVTSSRYACLDCKTSALRLSGRGPGWRKPSSVSSISSLSSSSSSSSSYPTLLLCISLLPPWSFRRGSWSRFSFSKIHLEVFWVLFFYVWVPWNWWDDKDNDDYWTHLLTIAIVIRQLKGQEVPLPCGLINTLYWPWEGWIQQADAVTNMVMVHKWPSAGMHKLLMTLQQLKYTLSCLYVHILNP